MENWTHINNVFWNMRDMRIADLYKHFLWDYNSKKEFYDEINKIIAEKHKKIIAINKVNVAKRYRED